LIDEAKHALSAVQALRTDLGQHYVPPDNGVKADGMNLVPSALFGKTRGYLEKIANQANGAYSQGWYDASAVMVRRLMETLIIEAFEKHNIADRIKSPTGDFFYLRDLIDRNVSEKSWNLSRNTKAAMPRLKDVGDKSAHSRRFNAVRDDLESLKNDLRVVTEELLVLAGLR